MGHLYIGMLSANNEYHFFLSNSYYFHLFICLYYGHSYELPAL